MIKKVEAPEWMKEEVMEWLEKGFDSCRNNLTLKWEYDKRRENYEDLIVCGNDMLQQFDDTKIVCVLTYSGVDGQRTIALTRSIMEKWNVTEKEIIDQCFDNVEDEIFHLRPMGEVLTDITGMNMDEFFVPEEETMYVLTNKSGLNGSRVLLSGYTQRFLKEKFKKFFIIPSSIHEVLIVAGENKDGEKEHLEELVETVNDTQVEERDRLSYKVAYVA